MPAHTRKPAALSAATIRRRRLGVAAALVVVIAAAGAGVVLATKHHPSHAASGPAAAAAVASRCPLTDLPAPGGKVPQRPALLVKIGNEPNGARPQSGLNEADIVYDTPAEGFIMRYMAVYQCTNASMIGPDRSLRWVDYHLAGQFGSPILAFAGGINPNLQAVQALPWLHNVNLLDFSSPVGVRTTNRVPPDNLYTSTQALYGLFPKDHTPPAPVFTYTSSLPKGAKPLSAAALNFSVGTDVVWHWNAAGKDWLHTYANSPDVDALTNQQVSATNVVVEIVHYTFGPYPESPGGTGDVESQTTGSGQGYVLRGGHYLPVTWHRASDSATTTFTDAAGNTVGLAPGRTWVELMTTTQAKGGITFTP